MFIHEKHTVNMLNGERQYFHKTVNKCVHFDRSIQIVLEVLATVKIQEKELKGMKT